MLRGRPPVTFSKLDTAGTSGPAQTICLAPESSDLALLTDDSSRDREWCASYAYHILPATDTPGMPLPVALLPTLLSEGEHGALLLRVMFQAGVGYGTAVLVLQRYLTSSFRSQHGSKGTPLVECGC